MLNVVIGTIVELDILAGSFAPAVESGTVVLNVVLGTVVLKVEL